MIKLRLTLQVFVDQIGEGGTKSRNATISIEGKYLFSALNDFTLSTVSLLVEPLHYIGFSYERDKRSHI